MNLILASGSPRRKEIMDGLGIPYTVCVSGVDEWVSPEYTPGEAALITAQSKARSVLENNPYATVIGCDTVVGIKGLVLNKPSDEEEAFQMLKLLSGKVHKVYTGVCIMSREKTVTFCEETTVSVIKLTDAQIREYIKSENVLDKAGAYAIQGKMGLYIDRIEGDYNNVVGMPAARVLCELQKLGF